MRIIRQAAGRFPLDKGRSRCGLGFVFMLEVDGASRYDGGNGVFVNHLGYGSVSQKNDVLVERFDLTCT